ncbi:unnamed protein product [Paramecium primaurelia]|uniref:Uncharacterized protein n=1 Tax=Paramecium primaurelia TaxID=5886 RepID=A0A8S1Q4E5_PARPR|nr:unnamed protein product [Paramecium primaurelia]
MNISKQLNSHIPQSQHYIRESLYTLIFTINQLIIAAGLEKFIIYSLKNGQLKFLGQVIQNDIIFSLCQIKCSNSILSGNIDGEIKIWHHTGLYHSKYLMKLQKHNSKISNIIMNKDEDQIYSCSTSIIVIDKKQQYKYCQNILQNTTSIRCMSLHESQNKLIVCGLEKQIIILQQDPLDLKWNKIQKINIKTNGERLCFINDNQFVFQQYLKNQIQLFEFNYSTKQFQQSKEIKILKVSNKCNFGFQMQFCKERQILINKNTQFVNIIKITSKNEFIIISQIDFDTSKIFGSMSEDGKYLITWDDKSKCVQLWELTDLHF